MTARIPQPPTIPFLGNVAALDRDLPQKSFSLLAQAYGEIYQLNLLGKPLICINSHALFNEVSDETRFRKKIGTSLGQVRNLVHDGLFTAHHDEPNWAIAHRILMPAFGTVAVHGMLEDMRDICSQLLLKWERFGPTTVIDATDHFTRLALDTIALCSMGHRLNSFYMENSPPFADSMTDFLKECFARATRLSVVQSLMPHATAKYHEDIKLMTELATQIVAQRRARPTDKKDLLNAMLNGRDPKTGLSLSDENITHNLLTFLIAGHETTSGTLSFAVYYLLKNPDSMRKLREEIDNIIGDQPAQYQDLSKMHYLHAVLRETLRLAPPAAARTITPIKDTTIGNGKYALKAGVTIACQVYVMQRDPVVWGDDATQFRPERMMDGKFETLPPNAWQPFGYGMRACIGRPFAWQEMQLVLASILQKFDLSLVDPSYTLELKQSLTIKPKGFYIYTLPRITKSRFYHNPNALSQAPRFSDADPKPSSLKGAKDQTQPVYVLYGSNTGTSEAFAQRIANDALSYGFKSSLGTLDSATGYLPTDGPLIIVTASFEGEPADNAAHFMSWLENLKEAELTGVRYVVFGCGNRDWVHTYQRVPKLCDEIIERRGGKRLMDRGEGDAGQGDFFQVFDEFTVRLWKVLCQEYRTLRNETMTTGLMVKIIDPGTERASNLRQADAALGRIVENRILTKAGAPIKRHIEFELPEGMTARAGDYLAVLPHNPPRDVRRVLSRFGLSEDHQVIISSLSPTSLPVDKIVNLSSLLSGYVELSQPATTRNLRAFIDGTTSEATRGALEDLLTNYSEKVLAKRLSVLNILEANQDIQISLGDFLHLLPTMRVRQYSISSSPLWNPQHVTLTISVVDAPSLSGAHEPFLGVASNYLANLKPGERVQIAVRPSSVAFHPPADPTVPMVMFCAGSGIAPMRAFMQERAAQKQSGRPVRKMLLFFGCRSPDEDYLYADSDLAEWTALGVVDVRTAFSRSPGDSEGCRYVQHRIWHDRADISKAYDENAKFFTCGSAEVARAIKSTLIEIIQEKCLCSSTEAAVKFDKITMGRYVTDVFD